MRSIRSIWKPVLLQDAKSIDLLNALFEKGWYLREEVGRIPVHLYEVSPADLLAQLLPDDPPPASSRGRKTVPMLMLAQGEIEGRQMAMEVKPNAQGYKDLALFNETLRREAEGWEPKFMISLPDMFIAIIERKRTGTS